MIIQTHVFMKTLDFGWSGERNARPTQINAGRGGGPPSSGLFNPVLSLACRLSTHALQITKQSDIFEGDAQAADKVQTILAHASEASDDEESTAETMVPWVRVAPISNHPVNACGREPMDLVRRLQAQGVSARRSPPITSSSTFVLLEGGKTSATVA
jgi:hypothetical protein